MSGLAAAPFSIWARIVPIPVLGADRPGSGTVRAQIIDWDGSRPDVGAAPRMGPVRTILHVDMDAFFVAVELRRRPELRGQPVVVGGTGRRGVVAAASYEARRFGVHSAMPTATARRLCPSAVFLPGDHAAYAAVSRAGPRASSPAVTPLVEPLALDEAFLDVTGARRLLGDGVTIARGLRARASSEELELTCSVGVATEQVPRQAGLRRRQAAGHARRRPARARGVRGAARARSWPTSTPSRCGGCGASGRRRWTRLERMGVATVGDLAALEPAAVIGALGTAHGRHLLDLATAVDDRPVEVEPRVKSIGHEETFAHDLHDLAEVRRELVRLADARRRPAARPPAPGRARSPSRCATAGSARSPGRRRSAAPIDTADAIVPP